METIESQIRCCAGKMEQAGLHFGHGTDNALDEAAWLVLATLGAPLDGRFENWNQPVTDEEQRAITQRLRQRIETREPLAYLLGEAWFCGLAFKVSPAVLVPRSPIAELILNRFQPWLGATEVRSVLDLCTGSACIAVALATHFPEARVDASDLSAAALDIARENVRMHALEARIRLVESDLFEALDGCRYDLLVSNPPYVAAASVAALPAEFKAEPELGLLSGSDGLNLPLRILQQAADHLEPGGLLVCEVGESAEALQTALGDVPLTWLTFTQGGEGVFCISRELLLEFAATIARTLENRTDVDE